MALRVLLADESSTIKKVMQLALQDFGVEVKSVPVGLDVIQVAKSFRPDLIFADVLLSKKTGYEVAQDLKADEELKSIPVVLMWSGFMELDEAKTKQCGAERRLEKPFDAEHLRALVKDLVPRLGANQIADYLSFPDLPEIVETPQEKALPSAPPTTQVLPPEKPVGERPKNPLPSKKPSETSTVPTSKTSFRQLPPPATSATDPGDIFSMGPTDLEDPDEFQQVPLPGSKASNVFQKRENEDWRQGGLEQFRVIPDESPIPAPDGMLDLLDASVALTDGVEDVSLDDLDELSTTQTSAAPVGPPPTTASSRTFGTRAGGGQGPSIQALDPVRAEEVLREQVREVLETIAWKIIPDIAERVVREEIQKLLKEAERLS